MSSWHDLRALMSARPGQAVSAAVSAAMLLACLDLVLVAPAAAAPADTAASAYPGIGRGATPKELAAWDIDVRSDFKGLPKGSGTVAQGMDLWEAQCASCHGVFGESNQTFSPLVGGTTADDVKTGRVARLNDPAFPGRTTLMKVASISTLWDYIRRAMPWNAPKSLKTDEVYAVTAYLLNLGGVLPDDFTLSDQTMAAAQARLPNRNGMTTEHGLWPGKGMGNGGQPDVKVTACMKDCGPVPVIRSSLPDYARNQHGNLADQTRMVGAQRGADTTAPPLAKLGGLPPPRPPAEPAAQAGAAPAVAGAAAAIALTQKYTCVACHGVENKIVGPAFRDIAQKYGSRGDAVAFLAGKIRAGGAGVWGDIPMPPQALSEAEAKTIAEWLASGASK